MGHQTTVSLCRRCNKAKLKRNGKTISDKCSCDKTNKTMKDIHERYGELWDENQDLKQQIMDREKQDAEMFLAKLKEQIINLEDSLVHYRKKLSEKPKSLFYRGSITNYESLISELKETLKGLES